MHRPLLLVSLAFTLGIPAAVELRLPVSLALAMAVLFFLAAWIAHRREWAAAGLLLLLAFFGLGLFRAGVELAGHHSALLSDLHTHLSLTGTVAAEPRRYEDRAVYLLRAENISQGGRQRGVHELVQLTVFRPAGEATGGPGEAFHYGDRLQAYGQLELPPVARNPGEMDYRALLSRQGIYTAMTLDAPEAVQRLGRGPVNPLLAAALWAKGRAEETVEENLPPEQAGVLLALLFGDQERLSDRQVDLYRSLGLFHLFAVSGMQVAFVLLFFTQLGGLFRLGERGRAGMSSAGIVFYALITGFSASVLRASVMALVGLGAGLTNRRQDFYTSLALAALLLLLWRPLDIYDRGFQLSFLATFSLVYLYPLWEEMLAPLPAWRSYASLTLAAQLGVLPAAARFFNLVSPVALLANLLVVPVVGAVTVAGLGLLLLAVPAPGLAAPLALASGAALHGVQAFLALLARLPGSALAVATPGWPAVILAFLALVAAREALAGLGRDYWRGAGREGRGKALALALLAAAVLLPLVHMPGRGVTVTFLDVGQGSAVDIALPGHGHLLVDGGGRPAAARQGRDVGDRVVAPYLIRQGGQRPWLFSSHPDSDHLQGLLTVLDRLRPRQAVTPPREFFGQGYDALARLAAARSVPLAEAQRGETFVLPGGGLLQALYPAWALSGTRSDDNNNSLVLRLSYGSWSVLLPGDLEAEGMRELAQSGLAVPSTIFLVPHHGSRYGQAEEFLDRLSPQAAVIQVGAGNTFGHPAPEVLQYWEERGVPVYRTDRDGAIIFQTDGQGWSVRTMAGTRRPPAWEPAPPEGLSSTS